MRPGSRRQRLALGRKNRQPFPKTSASFQPNIRSALSFQRMTRSSASTAMIASGEALMIASSTNWTCYFILSFDAGSWSTFISIASMSTLPFCQLT